MTDAERKALVERFTQFLSEWGKSRQYGETIYGLHVGDEREVELTVTSIQNARDLIEADGQRIAELEERYNQLGEAALSQVADLASKLGRKEVELDAELADLNSANRRIAELEALFTNATHEAKAMMDEIKRLGGGARVSLKDFL